METTENLTRLLRQKRIAERRRILAAVDGNRHEVEHVAGLLQDRPYPLLVDPLHDVLAIVSKPGLWC